MKIPIILQSTKGKTKERLLKEFKTAWRKFLIAKRKIEKGKEDWALLWWLHESEQLKEKLSREEVDHINRYVRESGRGDMWEIEYN